MKMNITEIFKYLPHRYPFLLIDRVIDVNSEKTALTAIKNVTFNEHFFSGHFPGAPVMPGVLIIEALAQAAGMLIYHSTGIIFDENNWFFLVGVDNARFKRIVIPGDQLQLNIDTQHARRKLWKMKGVATVSNELACSAEILIARGAVNSDT